MNTLEQSINKSGWLQKKAVRKLADEFSKTLFDDEKLLGIAVSIGFSKEQLYVTNKRVVVKKLSLSSVSEEEISLSKIGAVSEKVDLKTGTTFEISTSDKTISIHDLNPSVTKIIKELLSSLRQTQSV